MRSPPTNDGYVADALYPSNFHPHFQPCWTDAMLVRHGFVPPRAARAAFSFVDLGCGDGIGLVLAAAAYPEGRFTGLDAIPGHIARGNALIARLGLTNIELRCATFQDALHTQSANADYVMAQGVLSWVGPANQSAVLSLAMHMLRPGGVASIGYNALPGWAWILPFQRLAQALSVGLSGTPADRFEKALERARELSRATGAIDHAVFAWFDERFGRLPRDYFAHEYLNAHWAPMWCSDVMAAMAGRGGQFIGDALTLCLREDFALKATWRTTLDAITAPAARAVARDLLINRWYRVDLYARLDPACAHTALQPLERHAATAARMAQHWATGTTAYDASFKLQTAAGTIRFANDAARSILHGLQNGPATLTTIQAAARQPLGAVDLLNTTDALWMADLIRPVEPATDVPSAAATNAALWATANDAAPMNGLVGRYGGVAVPRTTMAAGLSAAVRLRLGILD